MSAQPAHEPTAGGRAIWTEGGHYLRHQDRPDPSCHHCARIVAARSALLAQQADADAAAERERQRAEAFGVLRLVAFVVAVVIAVPGLYISFAWFTNLGAVTIFHLLGPALLVVAVLVARWALTSGGAR